MAEADPSQQQPELDQETERRLRYLEFVQVAALHVVVYFSSLYNYAKNNSGPLKSGVQSVENTVKTVVGPVYGKFHGVPFEILKFVDRKVDSSVTEVDRHVPSVVKEASSQAYVVAREVASEVKRVGVVDATTELAKTAYTKYEPTAQDLYAKYEPVAEKYAVTAWRKLNHLPLFPQVAHIVVPTAAYWSEKYNKAVGYASERGFAVSSYLPLVPVDRIAKVFGEEEKLAAPSAAASSSEAVMAQ